MISADSYLITLFFIFLMIYFMLFKRIFVVNHQEIEFDFFIVFMFDLNHLPILDIADRFKS